MNTPPKPNPLSNRPAQNRDHPLMMHAKLAHFAHSLPTGELAQKHDLVGYVTPILGELATDPDVTSKDVIKAAATAVADGKIPASAAVQFLSQVPSEADQVQPWLKGLYAQNMTALVHMKAAMMKNGMPLAPSADPSGAAAGRGTPAPTAAAPALGAAT